MKINHTHISHFDIVLNRNVVAHDALVQFTGSASACKRFAAYLGLARNQRRMDDGAHEAIEGSYDLVDVDGTQRGQLHILDSGVQLVLNRAWFEQEVTLN